MKSRFLKIGEASKLLGISQQTLRNWEKNGYLLPEKTPSGHRLYPLDKINSFINLKDENSQENTNKTNNALIYARVSTKKQNELGNLDRQIRRLTEYAIHNKFGIKGIFTDIASGMNENRPGLKKLLQTIKNKEATIVIVEYKDRLARFGFNYIQQYINDFEGELIVVEERSDISEEQELVEDLIAITTSFSGKIYGKRGGKKAKTI